MDENTLFTIRGIETAETISCEKTKSNFRTIIERFFSDRTASAGFIIVALIVLLSLIGPALSPNGYTEIISAQLDGEEVIAAGIGPTLKLQSEDSRKALFNGRAFLFGTDDLGRDLWSRTWHGARVSLIIAFVTIAIDIVIGMSYGLISGYAGGITDSIMQRIIEIINCVPGLVIVAVLAIFMPKGMGLVIVALAITEWIGISKIARAQMLKLKKMEYVMASRTLGSGHASIIFRTVLPNTLGPVITQVMFSIPSAIFTEAFLSFVGVGITLPDCSVGSLIQAGFENISTLPYQILPPILVLALLMLGFSAIGEGLRHAIAPGVKDQ